MRRPPQYKKKYTNGERKITVKTISKILTAIPAFYTRPKADAEKGINHDKKETRTTMKRIKKAS